MFIERVGLKKINKYRSLIPVEKTYGHARDDEDPDEIREDIEQALLLEKMDINVHSQGI